VDEVAIPGREDESQIVKRFTSHYNAPAYIRRAPQVEDAFEQVVRHCDKQRGEWLLMVRVRLGFLEALAGDWNRVRPWLRDDEQITILTTLVAMLTPRLRCPPKPVSSGLALRRPLAELIRSIERFNRRWLEFLPTVHFTRVNQLRDGYNRYYLLEKECAIRSARLARQGFKLLEPATVADLMARLPTLPVPQLKE
jgi:hypothetical protein